MHGYMPQNLRDCVLIPIPKRNKDSSSSLNYRPISLASSLSKILERLILIKYAPYLSSSSLQFGFKAGSSTTLCTGTVKNIISNYIHNGSPVLGCFLDASKAFDLVNHGILFQKLYDRGLSQTVIRFLSSWYLTQQMSVRWGNSLSDSFKVTNGVRQGSVLSPVLFSVYLDGLLEELGNSGVGCHWGCLFAGAICYSDDIVLLAPCPSALRIMLKICDKYAHDHGLSFNADKTQLICFRSRQIHPCTANIAFNNIKLKFQDEVTHLGHILSYDLDDREDILRAIKDINRKANSILCSFNAADPFTKSILIKSYCLSLYGCSLWSLSSTSLKLIEVAVNKLLRKIWNLTYNSHTGIVHCVARFDFVCNLVSKRFCSFIQRSLSSEYQLIRSIFRTSLNHAFSFTGYNHLYGTKHLRNNLTSDFNASQFIRQIRSFYGIYSPFEDLICYISCN